MVTSISRHPVGSNLSYYGLAANLARLSYVGWTMETSLLKTLARKNNTSLSKEATRLQSTTQTPEGPRKCLKLIIPREKKTPLVAIFGGRSYWIPGSYVTSSSMSAGSSGVKVWPILLDDS
jgi:hypothetical protein